MRVVRDLGSLPSEVAAAEAEATSAFGDGAVFVEPYVERGRHVEVQVVGTGHGVLVLGERDCSLQRRHQKVVEETPAPRLPERTRRALHDAARKAARAIDYRGAGTVEFLYDAAQDRFFFLEMNTRLQVEHPVTELVHGVDLVEMQLAVAEGRELERIGETYGHAIEARLYAEDPGSDYQPQSGTPTAFDVPGVNAEFDLLNRPGLRVDSGFLAGNEVTTHYDAMLAKVVAWAPDREQAARRLADALAKARIHGVTTNRDQLVATLRDGAFLAGEVSTAFLDERPAATSTNDPGAAAAAAAIALAEQGRRDRTVQRGIPVAWRNVPSQPQVTEFEVSTGSTSGVRVEWTHGRTGYLVAGHDVVAASPDRVTLATDGVTTTYDVAVNGDRVEVDAPGRHVRLRRVPRFVDPAAAAAAGSLLAPMPGTVVSVLVAEGDPVEAGAPVLVLEAMKMQHTVSAPASGTVTEIDVKAGMQVAAGEVLAVVSTSATTENGEEP
jgi:propionyl-CoA carboxylase alpha chain